MPARPAPSAAEHLACIRHCAAADDGVLAPTPSDATGSCRPTRALYTERYFRAKRSSPAPMKNSAGRPRLGTDEPEHELRSSEWARGTGSHRGPAPAERRIRRAASSRSDVVCRRHWGKSSLPRALRSTRSLLVLRGRQTWLRRGPASRVRCLGHSASRLRARRVSAGTCIALAGADPFPELAMTSRINLWTLARSVGGVRSPLLQGSRSLSTLLLLASGAGGRASRSTLRCHSPGMG
jgi:hypothetical protein